MKTPSGMKVLSSSALLLAGAILSAPLGAATYYVSPDGDDANPGTAESPKRCIQAILDTKNWRAGDELVLKKGTYHLQDIKYGTETGALHLNGRGTICGETGNPADVVIDGDATTECIRLAGRLFVHGITPER